MDKEQTVLDFLKLYDILEERTNTMCDALEKISFSTDECFLNEAYDWIYEHFNEPTDKVNESVSDLFNEHNVKELIKLLKI